MCIRDRFNGDLSKWDVSHVTIADNMFNLAKSFNGDLSKWDVSRVTNMDFMFEQAESFNQILCGAAWVNSKASKKGMFAGSSGSISGMVCTTTSPAISVFSPQSKAELAGAVDACLTLSPDGDCSNGPHGPIGEWDVSSLGDMSLVFADARLFLAIISKWDVSSAVSYTHLTLPTIYSV